MAKLHDELKFELLGIAVITLALLALASLLIPSMGTAGRLLNHGLLAISGGGRFLLPLFFLYAGFQFIRMRGSMLQTPLLYGLLLSLILILTFLHLHIPLSGTFAAGLQGKGGGLLGALGSYLLVKYFDLAGSYIILTSLLIIAVILFTGLSITELSRAFFVCIASMGQKMYQMIGDFIFKEIEKEPEIGKKVIINMSKRAEKQEEEKGDEKRAEARTRDAGEEEAGDSYERKQKKTSKKDEHTATIFPADSKAYQLPSTALLSPDKPKEQQGVSEKEINDKIRILEETLSSFGINARIIQVTVGPAITRYEIQPPAGIKVSRIVGLADDIALAMAAPQVRIEAPIPGRAAIGIEIPNRNISTVHLSELLESKEFVQSSSRLTVALGKDIAGTPIVADLTQMPHLLVAGSTGSGKSVCINTMVSSILFKATPEEVKFVLIDPKMVELTTYNGIPHLITPVVTNPKKAAGILHWAVKEMEKRYEKFAASGVKDISRYNELFRDKKHAGTEIPEEAGETGANNGPMPLIIVIIDELADLMMIAPAEVEDSICRLAQMARAAGMHLVVATQRPSVDVITGLIKANIPSRISFAVSSQMDSRTILDAGGAEKLLGKGDMLYFPVGASKPLRVQGAYLSDKEVETLTTFLENQSKPVFDEEVAKAKLPEKKNNFLAEEDDELLPQAVQLFIEKGSASVSLLQRRFRIGYTRAARLVDIMEQRGIVGKFDGSKPRPILMTTDQYKRTFANKEAG